MIKRTAQREKSRIKNRLPRFAIQAYSALVAFETEQSAPGPGESYCLLIPLRLRLSRPDYQLPPRFPANNFRVTGFLGQSKDSRRRIGESCVSGNAGS